MGRCLGFVDSSDDRILGLLYGYLLEMGHDSGITKAHAPVPRIDDTANEAASLAQDEAENPQHTRGEASNFGCKDHSEWFTCKQRTRVWEFQFCRVFEIELAKLLGEADVNGMVG